MNAGWPWCSRESGISGTEWHRILGIDPGLRITGYGVIERSGSKLRYVASGVIRVPDGELPDRLNAIFTQLHAIIGEHKPHESAIERVFVNVNPQSTLLLGQARGAAITALASSGLSVAEYSALQIKQSVVGYGKASKEQVQEMMVRLLSLPGKPSKDAADALACAVCHAHSRALIGTVSRLEELMAGAGLPRVRRGARQRRGRLSI